MKSFPKRLKEKLAERKANSTIGQLGAQNNLLGFSSND